MIVKKRGCTDPIVLNEWHAICAIEEIPRNTALETVLLEERISFTLDEAGRPYVWRSYAEIPPGRRVDVAQIQKPLPARREYGYVWTSMGEPPDSIFPLPEYAEPDRRNMNAGTIGVNISAPRAVENFLDMGHFAFVHTGILGEEPITEIKEYDVEIEPERGEIIATRCRAWQPKAAATAKSGMEVQYIYRVPHPYCSILYKSSPVDAERLDAIGLFVQPIDEEHVRAHMLLSLLDEDNTDTEIRRFQLEIFAQDKPILENQYPKRLPLDPRAETPIRADKSSVAYRRWLREKGITYGVIPAAA